MTKSNKLNATLSNPFGTAKEVEFSIPGQASYEPGLYEESLKKGYDLIKRPKTAPGVNAITRQHSKNRMTIWERISVLTDEDPTVLFQNWMWPCTVTTLRFALVQWTPPMVKN